MSIGYEIIDPVQTSNWDERLTEFPDHSSFHTRAWARVLHEAYGYHPHYFVFNNDGAPAGIVPLMEIRSMLTGARGVCLPFSDLCEPLLRPGLHPQDVLDVLFTHGKKRGWSEIEFRGGELPIEVAYPCSWYYRHRLEIPKSDAAYLSRLAHSTRNNLKKAQNSGVRVQRGNSPDFMEEFFRLNLITRKKHGLPPQPLEFFRKVQKYIMEEKKGSIFIARHGSESLSAVLCLECDGNALLKYAATRGTLLNLRPNNYLIWEIFKTYRNDGFRVMDFGRTDSPNDGLRRFKMGWDLEETLISYYRCDLTGRRSSSRPLYSIGLLRGVFRVMPIPILRLFGKLLYKHIG